MMSERHKFYILMLVFVAWAFNVPCALSDDIAACARSSLVEGIERIRAAETTAPFASNPAESDRNYLTRHPEVRISPNLQEVRVGSDWEIQRELASSGDDTLSYYLRSHWLSTADLPDGSENPQRYFMLENRHYRLRELYRDGAGRIHAVAHRLDFSQNGIPIFTPVELTSQELARARVSSGSRNSFSDAIQSERAFTALGPVSLPIIENPISLQDQRLVEFNAGSQALYLRSRESDYVWSIGTHGDQQYVSARVRDSNGAVREQFYHIHSIRTDAAGQLHVIAAPLATPNRLIELPADIALICHQDPEAKRLFLQASRQQPLDQLNLAPATQTTTSAPIARDAFNQRYRSVSRSAGRTHAGQVIEAIRSDPSRWREFLNKSFGGDEARFWRALDDLAANPDIVAGQWFHGSNSGLLGMMRTTQGVVLPVGQLMDRGLVPFGGELGLGAMNLEVQGTRFQGVNINEISGSPLSQVDVSVEYARRQFNRGFNWNRQLNQLFNSLTDMLALPNNNNGSHYDAVLAMQTINIAIRRLRLWDNNALTTHIPRIRNQLEDLIRRFPVHQSELRRILDYLSLNINPRSASLTNIDRSLISQGFPVVIASRTIPNRRLAVRSDFREVGARLITDPISGSTHAEAEMGRDIQFVFADSTYHPQLNEWLRSMGLKDRVRVLNIDTLSVLRATMRGHQNFTYPDGAREPENLESLGRQIQQYAQESRGHRG